MHPRPIALAAWPNPGSKVVLMTPHSLYLACCPRQDLPAVAPKPDRWKIANGPWVGLLHGGAPALALLERTSHCRRHQRLARRLQRRQAQRLRWGDLEAHRQADRTGRHTNLRVASRRGLHHEEVAADACKNHRGSRSDIGDRSIGSKSIDFPLIACWTSR